QFRHGRDGRDGDADARQHAADDDGLRAIRPDRDGRHVHADEDSRRACGQRVQGPGRLQASGRHRRLRNRQSIGTASTANWSGQADAPGQTGKTEPHAQGTLKEPTMMSKPTIAAAAAAALLAGLVSTYAHEDHGNFSAGEPGDPKKPSRTVTVIMREGEGRMSYIPSRIEVRKGEQIRFLLRNDGALPHEFILATVEENLKHAEEMKKNPDMEHDDPNGK